MLRFDTKKALNFNCDFLRIYGTFKNEQDIFQGLNTKNSSIALFGPFSLLYTEAPNYEFKIMFVMQNVSVFAYYKGKEGKNHISTRDSFVVYGSAFAFMSFQEILDYIKENFYSIEGIARLDICLDVEYEISNLIKACDLVKKVKGKMVYPGAIIPDAQGNAQTLYIGNKNSKKNRSYFVRFYDKKADIEQKNKHLLHPGYMQKEAVTRLEVVLLRDLCRNIGFDSLYDENYLKDLFFSYVSKHSKMTFFNDIDYNQVSVYKRPMQDETTEKKYYFSDRFLAQFKGYAKNMLQKGFCPIQFLLEEGIANKELLAKLLEFRKENDLLENAKISLAISPFLATIPTELRASNSGNIDDIF